MKLLKILKTTLAVSTVFTALFAMSCSNDDSSSETGGTTNTPDSTDKPDSTDTSDSTDTTDNQDTPIDFTTLKVGSVFNYKFIEDGEEKEIEYVVTVNTLLSDDNLPSASMRAVTEPVYLTREELESVSTNSASFKAFRKSIANEKLGISDYIELWPYKTLKLESGSDILTLKDDYVLIEPRTGKRLVKIGHKWSTETMFKKTYDNRTDRCNAFRQLTEAQIRKDYVPDYVSIKTFLYDETDISKMINIELTLETDEDGKLYQDTNGNISFTDHISKNQVGMDLFAFNKGSEKLFAASWSAVDRPPENYTGWWIQSRNGGFIQFNHKEGDGGYEAQIDTRGNGLNIGGKDSTSIYRSTGNLKYITAKTFDYGVTIKVKDIKTMAVNITAKNNYATDGKIQYRVRTYQSDGTTVDKDVKTETKLLTFNQDIEDHTYFETSETTKKLYEGTEKEVAVPEYVIIKSPFEDKNADFNKWAYLKLYPKETENGGFEYKADFMEPINDYKTVCAEMYQAAVDAENSEN